MRDHTGRNVVALARRLDDREVVRSEFLSHPHEALVLQQMEVLIKCTNQRSVVCPYLESRDSSEVIVVFWMACTITRHSSSTVLYLD